MQANRIQLLTLLLAAACAGCGEAPAQSKPNVIVICMDTVRADRLGCYGYERRATTPTLDRLAEAALLFEDTSATAGWTKPSVPSFMTGTYPVQHGVYDGSARGLDGEVTDILSPEALTFAEVFSDHGWQTAAFIRNAQLRAGNGFEQGFDLYCDQAGDAREIRWRAQDWLDSLESGRPFMLYLHFLDAHWPYPVPDEYATKFADEQAVSLFRAPGSRALREAVNDGERILDESELEALGALYDGSLRYIDDQLALLFEGLEARGIFEDTIVCVIADHGEEFMEHGRIGHGHGLSESLLSVPWILRVPGREPDRIETPVSLVDLFPTLLSAAGIREVPATEGVDRLALPRAERAIFAEHKEPRSYLQAFRVGQHKLTRRFKGARAEVPELADVLRPGVRWEAKIRAGRMDRHYAARALELSSDPRSDPIEIKGHLGTGPGPGLWIEDLEVRLGEQVEFYGHVPEDSSQLKLEPGRAVKLVGEFEGRVFVARRVKLYEEGATVSHELRGPLTEVESHGESGRVRIGDVWIDFDWETRWDLDSAVDLVPDLARPEIVAVLASGADTPNTWSRGQWFDLRQDPGEQSPREQGERLERLWVGLEEFGLRLIGRGMHAPVERRALDEEALAKLRALGYVR